LGNRSLLARPDQHGIRDYINRHVKHREMWRPLCPSLLAGEAATHFAKTEDSLFMNIAHETTDGLEDTLPDIFHRDATARIQVVHAESGTPYSRVLGEIRARTGRGILLNTSFNLPRCPLVDSPSDAVAAVRQMNVSSLVLGHHILQKG
jgi:carbamoyltransferase